MLPAMVTFLMYARELLEASEMPPAPCQSSHAPPVIRPPLMTVLPLPSYFQNLPLSSV